MSILSKLPGIDGENTRRRNVLVGSGYALVGIVGAGAIAGPPEDDDPDFEDGSADGNGGNGEASVEEDVELLEHELVREDAGGPAEQVSIEGRAENTSDQSFSYVEVRGRFYNENGDLIESFIDNINDFDSGQTWSFEIVYPGLGEDAREVADYDVAVGTSF